MSSIIVNPCPSASTEIDAKLRTRFDLTNAGEVRVQAHVVTGAVGAKLTLKYSLDGGTVWAAVGPYVSVASSGEQRGASTNVAAAAKADVLLSLFVSGGDNATPLTLGNCGALVYVKSEAGDDTVITVGCAVPEGVQFEGTFGNYANIAALYAARGDDADGTLLFEFWYGDTSDSARTYLDASRLFNGQKPLVGVYGDGLFGSGFWNTFSTGSDVVVTYDDVTVFKVLEIEAGFDNTETGDGRGLYLFDLSTGGIPYNGATVALRSGHVYFTWYRTGAGYQNVDLGLASAWTGEKLQLVMRCKRLNTTDIQVSIYKGAPCETPALIHQSIRTAASATTKWEADDTLNTDFDVDTMPVHPLRVWLWQVSYSDDASVFGLTP